MSAPTWLIEARRHIGLREIPGARTAPQIAAWLQKLGAWWRDDETPWCGVAMAGVFQAVDLPIPKAWYRAKAWLDWGVPLAAPCLGCVVVFERQGGGHVGLVVGRDAAGRLMVLGGNQGDTFRVSPFDAARAIGYRYPAEALGFQPMLPVPLVASSGASSGNEA